MSIESNQKNHGELKIRMKNVVEEVVKKDPLEAVGRFSTIVEVYNLRESADDGLSGGGSIGSPAYYRARIKEREELLRNSLMELGFIVEGYTEQEIQYAVSAIQTGLIRLKNQLEEKYGWLEL